MEAGILPATYFDGLSTLWGACAYVASAIVAAALAFEAARAGPSAAAYFRLLTRLLLVGVTTLFLREWLMRLNDVMMAFNSLLGIDPVVVDDRFVEFISGKNPEEPKASVWDVIWGTRSLGTAICYALLWMFGWLSWGLQYIVKLIGDILLTVGWALSPIFLAFYMIRPMRGVAFKYIIGLVALICWPLGWTIAAIVTNAMLDASSTASLIPISVSGSTIAPVLTVLLVGTWMIISSLVAPFVTTKILFMGANPAAAFAQGVGGAAQASVGGGLSAATTAVSGGAAAGAVVAAAAVGAMAAGTESAARGGRFASASATATSGLSGMYSARYAKQRAAAYSEAASAFKSMAASARAMAAGRAEESAFFSEARRRMNREQRAHDYQPHQDDPNKAALEIETYARN